MNPFMAAMQFIGLHEWGMRPDGGYTNDPIDPGGETKFGISKRANPNVDIKNLTLAQAMDIYKQRYWDFNQLDSKPYPYSVAFMDTCVNLGSGRAKSMDTGDVQTHLEQRRAYYLDLIARKKELAKYRNGWLNRCNDLAKYCEILVTEQEPPQAPPTSQG